MKTNAKKNKVSYIDISSVELATPQSVVFQPFFNERTKNYDLNVINPETLEIVLTIENIDTYYLF